MRKTGYYFVDRDGRLFGTLLEFLRTNRWKVPKDVDANDLLEEAEFYSINVHSFAPLSDAALRTWIEGKCAGKSIARNGANNFFWLREAKQFVDEAVGEA